MCVRARTCVCAIELFTQEFQTRMCMLGVNHFSDGIERVNVISKIKNLMYIIVLYSHMTVCIHHNK